MARKQKFEIPRSLRTYLVKTMLAHLAWGVSTENEIRFFRGCKGTIEDFDVYTLDWEFVRSVDFKGKQIIT